MVHKGPQNSGAYGAGNHDQMSPHISNMSQQPLLSTWLALWWSDIHALYQRALADEHLQGSAALADARGAELEALCKGWAQPANFR